MRLFYMILGYFFAYKTKQYRMYLYEEMISIIEIRIYGFCDAARIVTQRKWVGHLWRLPELYAYKPRTPLIHGFWWCKDKAGIQRRTRILREIITKMKGE